MLVLVLRAPFPAAERAHAPVSAAWSTWSGFPSQRVQSAGTAAPAARMTLSPGTRRVAFMLKTRPSRLTIASGFS